MYLGTIDNTPKHRKYIWLFFLIVLGFSAFAFDYALSRVTIKIFPKNIRQTLKTNITLDSSSANVNLEKLIFPVKVAEKEISLESNFSTTGVQTTQDFAHGQISIQSKREKDISLPKGFKVIKGKEPIPGEAWRDKIIFSLDEDVTIPAGGSIKVNVTAINKGPRGNIEPGPMYFASMAQWNRERLIPANEKSFTGGVIEKKVLTQADLDSAKNELLKKAKAQAVDNFSASLASDKKCQPELSYITITDYSPAQKINDVIDSFSAKLTGQAKVLIYSETDLKETLKKKLLEQFGTLELVIFEENSLKLAISSLDIENGKAQITAEVSGIFAPKFSSDIFEKKNLAGFNEAAIKQHYQDNPAIEKIEVQFFPFWRKTVPSLEDQVFVQIEK